MNDEEFVNCLNFSIGNNYVVNGNQNFFINQSLNFFYIYRKIQYNQMLNLISIFSFSSEKTYNYSFRCGEYNTFLEINGTCSCQSQYLTDDKFFEHGCFKCQEECHPMALCRFPGRCICLNEFYGDGIQCNLDIPFNLKLLKTKRSKINEIFLTISFEVPSQKKVHQIFYKVGNFVNSAKTLGNNKIECIIPPFIDEKSIIFISFDNSTWSDEFIFISPKEIEKMHYLFILLIILILFIVLFGIYYSYCYIYLKYKL